MEAIFIAKTGLSYLNRESHKQESLCIKHGLAFRISCVQRNCFSRLKGTSCALMPISISAAHLFNWNLSLLPRTRICNLRIPLSSTMVRSAQTSSSGKVFARTSDGAAGETNFTRASGGVGGGGGGNSGHGSGGGGSGESRTRDDSGSGNGDNEFSINDILKVGLNWFWWLLWRWQSKTRLGRNKPGIFSQMLGDYSPWGYYKSGSNNIWSTVDTIFMSSVIPRLLFPQTMAQALLTLPILPLLFLAEFGDCMAEAMELTLAMLLALPVAVAGAFAWFWSQRLRKPSEDKKDEDDQALSINDVLSNESEIDISDLQLCDA